MANRNPKLSRRNLLLGALHGTGLLVLSGCERVFDSLSRNDTVQSILETAESGNRRVQRLLTGRAKLAQEFTDKEISPTLRANGNPPPITMDYTADAQNQWTKWRLEVSGLVKQPTSFSLTDLKAMPSRTQITRHDCVEGWSVIGKWKGVRLATLLEQVGVKPAARYVVVHCFDALKEGGDKYYESLDLEDALHEHTILAYDLNNERLPLTNC